MEWLQKNWQRPDEGIWEVRGGRREFVHSRMMCWVAFDADIRLAEKRSLSGPLDRWHQTRDAIRRTSSRISGTTTGRLSCSTRAGTHSIRRCCSCRLCGSSVPSTPGGFRPWTQSRKPHRGHTRLSVRVNVTPGRRPARLRGQLYRLLVLVHRVSGHHTRRKRRVSSSTRSRVCQSPRSLLRAARIEGGHLGNFPQAFTHLALISAATFLDRELSGTNRCNLAVAGLTPAGHSRRAPLFELQIHAEIRLHGLQPVRVALRAPLDPVLIVHRPAPA